MSGALVRYDAAIRARGKKWPSRAAQRRRLLDRIATLNVQVRVCPDAELREALEEAVRDLRRFDSGEAHQ